MCLGLFCWLPLTKNALQATSVTPPRTPRGGTKASGGSNPDPGSGSGSGSVAAATRTYVSSSLHHEMRNLKQVKESLVPNCPTQYDPGRPPHTPMPYADSYAAVNNPTPVHKTLQDSQPAYPQGNAGSSAHPAPAYRQSQQMYSQQDFTGQNSTFGATPTLPSTPVNGVHSMVMEQYFSQPPVDPHYGSYGEFEPNPALVALPNGGGISGGEMQNFTMIGRREDTMPLNWPQDSLNVMQQTEQTQAFQGWGPGDLEPQAHRPLGFSNDYTYQ